MNGRAPTITLMLVELTHPNGDSFDVTGFHWENVLVLARTFGWEEPADLSLGLSRGEAAALADALERGLSEVLAQPRPPRLTEDESDELEAEGLLPYVFTPRNASHWRGLIAFCRAGGVRIRIE